MLITLKRIKEAILDKLYKLEISAVFIMVMISCFVILIYLIRRLLLRL